MVRPLLSLLGAYTLDSHPIPANWAKEVNAADENLEIRKVKTIWGWGWLLNNWPPYLPCFPCAVSFLESLPRDS